MRYETLESGETRSLYDMLQQRNEDMYLDLYMKADEIKKTSVAPKGGRMKMGNRLTTCLYSYFARQPLMRREDYVSLDHEDLGAYYSCYMQMLEHYEIFEVPSTRQLFSAYMGITVSKFIDLMSHSDPDIKERALMINDSFDGQIFASAESGSNNATAALTRAKTKDVGQGHTVQKEELNLNITQTASPELLMQKARAIIEQKKLGGK